MPTNISYLLIIAVFLIYYLLVLFSEKKVIQDPKEILEKFLSTILLYAGISLIYFSLTGKPFLDDSPETYNIYTSRNFTLRELSVLGAPRSSRSC